MLAPPIQKNEDDELQKLLEEYNKVKINPMEQQRIEDIRKQQADSEFYNTLGMLGEKLGRSIGRTTDPVDKEFYQQLTKSSAQQAAQRLGDIEKNQNQRLMDFKTLNELRKQEKERKKDEAYLKIQQDQEERAKERFETDKQTNKLELDKAALSYQRDVEKDDPNSILSKTKVASLTVQYPNMKDLFNGKSFNELSILAEGIGGKLKRDDDMYNREQDREVKRQTQEMLNFNKQLQLDEKQKLNEAKQQDKLDKQVTNYKDSLIKTGIPDAVATLDQVDAILPAKGEDIPGFGATAILPDILTSKKGTDLRQIVNKLFNITLKQRSGAAVTDPELERLKSEFGQGKWKTDDQLRKGINDYKKILGSVIKNVNAGYRPEIRQQYTENFGENFDAKVNEYLGDQSSEVERMTSDGRIAIFDKKSKKFLRYK
jgi:hypothetical protein